MPGIGSHGWALTARDVASSSHPRLWFMARGVPEQEPAGWRRSWRSGEGNPSRWGTKCDPGRSQVRRFISPRLSRPRGSLPALKNGTVFSGMDTGSPVRGLCLMRA